MKKPRSDYEEDPAPPQPGVGSIVPLDDKPVKRKPRPIGFVQFKEAEDGKRE